MRCGDLWSVLWVRGVGDLGRYIYSRGVIDNKKFMLDD